MKNRISSSLPIILENMMLCSREGLNHRQVSVGDKVLKSGEVIIITGAVAPNKAMPRGCVMTKDGQSLNPLSLKLEWMSVQTQAAYA